MYKITREVGRAIVAFKSTKIGYIGPYEWINGDADYFIYEDKKMPATERSEEHIPAVEGFWLCRKSELIHSQEPMEIRRMAVDPFCTDEEEMIDISSCVIEGFPAIDRLTCKQVATLPRLLELEPKLKQILK